MSKPFDPRDRFFRKAKDEGFRARSAFKLKEILGRQQPIRKGWTVLDLGAAPGGFLQVLGEAVGPKGHVVGVDLTPIRELSHPGIRTLVADVEDGDLVDRLRGLHPRYDAVVSDMAPATTGSGPTDVARSHRLVARALEIAEALLRPGGLFVAKVFMGPGFEELVRDLRGRFVNVRIVRPEATRSRSRECFLVAKGYRPAKDG
jgi:23S rRNA (uridine2552-2'-O)-methyltransferase